MSKFLCIHGHFYQPPRENAWLEEIEVQDSAAPWHDWNERINYECYDPNGASRILNQEAQITDIVNNYEKISFNFGPTLLSWMEKKAPRAYRAILDADRKSALRNNGHGSAIAQVYNHMIMPLANDRDKATQIIWGLKDFESRFGRKSEGIWLAETAVDLATLELLVAYDVKYTILSPQQAKCFKALDATSWVNGIDTKKHYYCNLPSGKKIALFFYDGQIAQEVAFNGLLNNGKKFAERFAQAFDQDTAQPQLVHIATDGESYGHHHNYGDMALAYCLDYIERNNLAKIVNYGCFLAQFEPTHEVIIHENSSWSCVHGVERWKSNCGCNTGGNQGYNQEWRGPLREALDYLCQQTASVYEHHMQSFCNDPWALRNAYVEIILDRSVSNIDAFLKENLLFEINAQQRTTVLRLLEMQRQAMLMYTSCAWFFDELSGIETVQVLQYANRVIQLAESETKLRVADQFIKMLANAKSNIAIYENGEKIYRQMIEPKRLSLTKVGMHYAAASLIEDNPRSLNILNYSCSSTDLERFMAGSLKISCGSVEVKSKITLSQKYFKFIVVYLGQHHIIGNAIFDMQMEDFVMLKNHILAEFKASNLANVLSLMHSMTDAVQFSYWDLFKDEQLKFLNLVLEEDIRNAESSNRKVFNRSYNLMQLMKSSGLTVPVIFNKNAEIVVNEDLKRFFKDDTVDLDRLNFLIDEKERWSIELEKDAIQFLAQARFIEIYDRYVLNLNDTDNVRFISKAIDLLNKAGIKLESRELQNKVLFTVKDGPINMPDHAKEAVNMLCKRLNIDYNSVVHKAITQDIP